MRFVLFFAALCASAFAYKDAFYIGAYGGVLDGTLEKESRTDLENQSPIRGFRLGWNNNMRSSFSAKIRWELFGEQRYFKYDFNGANKEEKSWHAGASVAFGYNVDWFLTRELVPYFKIGAGLGGFGEDLGDGSNLHLAAGVVFSLRYFELTAEARREFWQLSGYRIPFQTPFTNDGSIDVLSAGLNFKF
ncbi:MAG: hypothetical protein LBF86_05845 [Helicobacteraceae bacterium]|jgi:hypothetical protein|nr:hypothetical protein [Helicobacteraceae bacterium]